MVRIQQMQDRGAAVVAAGIDLDHAVVSGEESDDHHVLVFPSDAHQQDYHLDSCDDDDDEEEEEEETMSRSLGDGNTAGNGRLLHGREDDDLYDKNLDAEDEAYVYKNMRGGVREMVTILQRSEQQDHDDSMNGAQDAAVSSSQTQRRQLPVYKPRNSDGVLSCPCCFNIVCMDCQRHNRYPNQFRAIFVMGITVDWCKILVHDPLHQALIPKSEMSSPEYEEMEQLPTRPQQQQRHHHAVPMVDEEEQHDIALVDQQSLSWLEEPVAAFTRWRPPPTKVGEYFAVECATCRTQVAALDMREEVYHFHGCLESSAPTY
ncbi:E2F-associated phosphodomain containing protein [Nitzschia inconspicua]|uniref:E2F-associated phosphodomain containing protein n=1 Tax=Nitzschia inconspicua TaxID=303405 RepID=A0A9K3LIP4_9STRA|nr:E2F-associated phosphodomain containing protein [Nitzschia inconspicua]